MRVPTGTPSRTQMTAVAAAAAVLLVMALVSIPLVDEDSEESGDRVAATASEEGTGSLDSGIAGVDDAGATTGTGATAGSGAARTGGTSTKPGATKSAATGTATSVVAGLTASDRGVTATTIKLGIMLLNVGGVQALGVAVGVNPEQQQKAWEAFIAEVNDKGGVLGRKISPVFTEFDVTDNASMRAACLRLAKDAGVFTVLDIALNSANALCVTSENQTPLITLQSMPKEHYEKSQGRLYTLFGEGSRVWRNTANDLHFRGALKGKTIGILTETSPGTPATMDSFIAELQSLGYKVAHRSNLISDGSAGTLPQASSQIPLEVRAMQQAGVDLVVLATGVYTATQFVQQADSQRYYPKYFNSDFLNAYSDTYPQNMPESFDGTLITTNRTGEFRKKEYQEPDTERNCRQIYDRRTGAKLDRTGGSPPGIEYNSTVRLCTLLDVFVRGATAAGPKLTRPALGTGIQSVGPLPLSTFGGGSFRPGKFDAADLIRTARFSFGCKCWLPVDPFRPVRYS